MSKSRVVFISDEEIRDSEGELDVQPKEDGRVFTVQRGSVLGWFVVKVFSLERQLESQAGLLHAAGLEVQRLRAEVARQKGGGLIVPDLVPPKDLRS